MNLIVLKPDNTWYTRPDSTLCRVREDFFLPEGFVSVAICNCKYIRLLKAGKSIQPRFAERYLEPLCEGWLYYGLDCDGKANPYIDRSTVLEEEKPTSFPDEGMVSRICAVSAVMTLRRGDLVIVENGDCSVIKQGDTINSINIK